MAPTFLVTAASGAQGSGTVRALLAANAKVHALVRDPASPISKSLQDLGAILFEADFDALDAIRLALDGVEGVFLNPIPGPAQVSQARGIIDLARSIPAVKTMVLSTIFFTADHSIWGDEAPDSTVFISYSDKLKIEEAVKDARFENYTILRPAWLHHNYCLPQSFYHSSELSERGELAHALEKDTRISHLDTEDVGKFAAKALLEPKIMRSQEVELGNENLTIGEVAEILARVLRREVTVRKRRPEEEEELKNKFPALSFQTMAARKDMSIDGKELEQKYGIKLTSFEEFCVKNKEVLNKDIGGSKL